MTVSFCSCDLTLLFLSGDLAERIGGLALRHLCSVLQSIQLVVNVGIICLYGASMLSSVEC